MSAALLVADSGPLIALARLDLLGLPARYFESVLVTFTVWEEVNRKPGIDEAPRFSSAASAGLIRVVSDPETIPESLSRTTIDEGELGAIALAIELNASLLIDDRRARLVLLRAREDGLLPALRPLLDRLQASGYYLPGELVLKILASLGE